ncbi:MAG: hypothetical protein JWM11_2995 [Planctomycetaceae bacterium]|nr:hypothetical protein [Planctomycetaceae bacterium]
MIVRFGRERHPECGVMHSGKDFWAVFDAQNKASESGVLVFIPEGLEKLAGG